MQRASASSLAIAVVVAAFASAAGAESRAKLFTVDRCGLTVPSG
jgi:hypothetical protein